MNKIISQNSFSTAEVAQSAGVHKDTLLRWLRSGLVSEPARNRHGWRYFSPTEAQAIVLLAKSDSTVLNQSALSDNFLTKDIENLRAINWDFNGAKTNYLTHGIHPYPAKFIPQIPNALIQELSSVGDTVGDIFCGSGTTLVEALTLKRNAVGVDANPLACLITKSKTGIISEQDAETLMQLVIEARSFSDSIIKNRESPLFENETFISSAWRPGFAKLNFWFDAHVIEELAEIRRLCDSAPNQQCRNLALTSMSAIVVAVSKQDSDTRYVRREKNILPGETFKRFARTLEQNIHVASEFSEFVEQRFSCDVVEADLLAAKNIPQLDLMVCSPPYPNAFSYHLYHMTRMAWLGMDQPKFKSEEIGSHRKYSSTSKNAATVETFRSEFSQILIWLSNQLKRGGYACFVVGDSTLKGQRINNADLISAAGREAGFVEAFRIGRTMQSTKKSFNPAIGKIKNEDILILENRRGG